jgi:hypothetical protein
MTKPQSDAADMSAMLEAMRKTIDDLGAAYGRLTKSHMTLLGRFNDLEAELQSPRR